MKLSYLIIISLVTIMIVIFAMLIILHFGIAAIHQVSLIHQLPATINNDMDKISTAKYLNINESFPIIIDKDNKIIIDKISDSKDLEGRMKINHIIEYGTPIPNHAPKRTPFVMIRSSLSFEVFNAIQQLTLFISPLDELPDHRLYKAIDYPKSKHTHFYYEGYFHSLISRQPILSRNPRSGKEFLKPPIDLFITAFFESFRRLNRLLFHELQMKLFSSAITRFPMQPNQDVCGLLSDWIGKGYLFSDLSVQLHYGSAIKDKELFWHNDAENSLLHFGMSIHGTRILHSKRAKTPSGIVNDILDTQSPGDVYLSSSTLVNHAPEYPNATWDQRIIAIQARILYNTSDLKLFRSIHSEQGWMELTNIIANTLSASTLIIPTLSDIQQVMKEI